MSNLSFVLYVLHNYQCTVTKVARMVSICTEMSQKKLLQAYYVKTIIVNDKKKLL